MGERRQVAGGADGALARDDRHDIALEQREHELDQPGAHAGVPAPQRAGEQQQHPAHDLVGERRPGADGVRAHEVDLELRGVGGRDPHAGELPEAGRDAVDRAPARERRLDDVAGGGDALAVGGVERRRGAAACDGLELLQRRHAPKLRVAARLLDPARGDLRPAPPNASRMFAALAPWS